MNHDTTRDFGDDAMTAAVSPIGFDQDAFEYADEYAFNDIGLALRLHALAESE